MTWQSGTNWERTETLGGVNPTGEPTEIGVTVPLEVEGSRDIDPHYWVEPERRLRIPDVEEDDR